MCNCGKKRADYPAMQSSRPSGYKNIESAQNNIRADVYFEYTGFTALSVTGKISGRHYRFTQPGNMQPVDYRDASAMMAVPVLKRTNGQ